MNKNRYVPTALSMYLNYVVHGMGVIMLSQNQNALMAQWNTDLIGVSSVISMLGIGRLIAIVFSGPLSDFDSGTCPALMESFPKNAGTANVLIKAAVQIGQFILPFVIALLIASKA